MRGSHEDDASRYIVTDDSALDEPILGRKTRAMEIADKITQSVFFRTDRNAGISTFVILIILGILIGLTAPPDDDLGKPYRYFSNVIGYTYFFAWSLSFYPQIYLNWRRKTTVGLSSDYQTYNILGFVSYTIFNVAFYFVGSVQDEYEDRYNSSNKVQLNDVLFAVHAVAATIVTLSQIVYYDGVKQMPSLACRVTMVVLIFLGFLYLFLVMGGVNRNKEPFAWLDWLYFLSYIKMLITLIKYVPQAVLNYRRQSTVGWNIWNVLLDFTGGTLSLLQLLLDCADTGDWQGIAGDPVKFGLGFISIVFDVTFMIQHYVLYPQGGRYNPLQNVTDIENKF